MGILESRWLDLLRLAVVVHALYSSVTIRLFAVEHYGASSCQLALMPWFSADTTAHPWLASGRVIHEFDPWFNYRATEYMVEHGWDKFQVQASTLHTCCPLTGMPSAACTCPGATIWQRTITQSRSS